LVNAQYDLTLERQTTMDNILFIPGIANPVSEINALLFGAGQQGTFIAPSLTPSLISGSTFGTGVETLTDLSPRNNPFSQATPSNRAAWFREPKTGRTNQFTWTEDFTNTVWSAGSQIIATQVSGLTPRGTAIQKLVPDTSAGFHRTIQNNTTFTTGQTVTFTVLLKAAEVSDPRLSIQVTGGVQYSGVYNLATGVFTNTDLTSGSMTPIGDGWFECVATLTLPAASASFRIFPGPMTSYTGDGTSGILASAAKLGAGVFPYQRVTTAFDVTEAGQRDCYGVRADGTDDAYVTAGNVDFSGINKVTVFAAIRKRSDVLRGVVAISGGVTAVNSFHITAPGSDGANTIIFSSSGDGLRRVSSVTAAAPVTAVVTGIGDISQPLSRVRVNGVESSNTGSQGAGNYSNAGLGLLAGAGQFFNGDLYACIIAGGSYPLSTIQRVERLLSRITPTVNL
jgi:uncharacterized membrane protein